MKQQQQIEEFLLKIIRRWEKVGTFVCSPDGHLFFQPCKAITSLHGALDMKKESAAVGAHIIIRRVNYRPKHSRYRKLPWFQVLVLPITDNMVAATTDAEQANRELNKHAMSLAHAVERDPEQAAVYHRLHEAHIAEHQAHPSCPPAGYKKFYPSFYGFVYATIRMRLVQESQQPAVSVCAPLLSIAPESHSAAPQPLSIAPASNAGITLCVPSSSARSKSCASIRLCTSSSRARSMSYASYRHFYRPRAA